MNKLFRLSTGIRLLLCSGLCVASIAAYSATATTTFTVSLEIVDSCTISATNMDFGSHSDITAVPPTTSTITVKCNPGTAYTVGLDAGNVGGSTLAARLMNNGVDNITFNLFTEAAHTNIWGDSATTPTWVSGTGNGGNQTLTVYGDVPTSATPLSSGTYTTTITATITYN